MKRARYKIALAGNPNSGKTTLFNLLTGSNQYVGNWPGVTVEKKSGVLKIEGCEIELVDLPGIYSLSPYTMEERVSRNYIMDENPDVILNIVDGTNLERNLYLSTQLMELGLPMVMAVNMADSMQARGDKCDFEGLSGALGIPIVPISAKKRKNIDRLMEKVLQAAQIKQACPPPKYDACTQKGIEKIKRILSENTDTPPKYLNFCAAKLLEGDAGLVKRLDLKEKVFQKIEAAAAEYQSTRPDGDREAMPAHARYEYIEGLLKRYLILKPRKENTLSDKIDNVVTNKYLAVPIFLVVMLAVFMVTFGGVGSFLKGGAEYIIDSVLAPAAGKLLNKTGAPEWTCSLFLEGVIPGVGAVVSFLPQIMLLFLFLSLLEDSGYMSRAAFIMDGFLRKAGLNGKAFIPMLMGFGCSVPAVMAARTMENEKERRLTIMLVPFMSCAARMPVYAMFAGVFFKEHQGLVVFSLYILGILVALLAGRILKSTLFKDNDSPFVLELPEYRMPSLNTLILHLWDKCRDFLTRAGTLIFSMTVIIWVLRSFDFTFHAVQNGEQSMLGGIGKAVAPVFAPLGFGFWQAAVSLLSGLVAKEAVISSMTVLYGAASQEALSQMLPELFNPAAAYAFMVFVLLYIPCVAAFGAIKREMNSWKWALGTAAMQLGIAYAASFAAYRIGCMLAG